MSATVISIANQKGGVGKTTTAVNLSYYLAKLDKKTLLIDFDPQGNATSGFGVDKQKLAASMTEVINGKEDIKKIIIQVANKKLFLAPTATTLANAEVDLTKMDHRFSKLKSIIADLRDDYDFILIDNPPSLNLLTINGLIAADYVLMPVQVEFYALEGLGQLLESIKLIRKAMNQNLEIIGVLPTMMDSRTVLSAQVYEEIKKYFPKKMFKTSIPRNIRLAEAPSHGLPIGLYDKFSKGARAYKALAKEVIDRV